MRMLLLLVTLLGGVSAQTQPHIPTSTTPGPTESQSNADIKKIYNHSVKVFIASELNRPLTANAIVLQYNDLARIQCIGQDRITPADTAYWFKDGVALNMTGSVIVIDAADATKGGEYSCNVTSGSGRLVGYIHVFVAAQPRVFTDIKSFDDTNATDKVSVKVLVGEEIELNLTTSVYPASLINLNLEFTRSSEDVTKVYKPQDLSGQVEAELDTESSNTTFRYIIKKITRANHGIYKFQLKYGREVQTMEFLLSVESPPAIKSFQKFPSFVSVGNDIALTCDVGGYPRPEIRWYHEPCCTIPPQPVIDISKLISEKEGEFSYYHQLNEGTILNLIGGKVKFNGSFWFEVENSVGKVVSEKTMYRIKGWGISVGSTEVTESQNIGALVLTCHVNIANFEGETFATHWYHGGVKLSTNITDEKNETTYKYLLTVPKPTLEHGGQYQCLAVSNTKTLWSDTVNVRIVRQPTLKVLPVIYQAVAGATAIFSCVVSNIDGDYSIMYRIKDLDKKFVETETGEKAQESGLLYIRNVSDVKDIRCEPDPMLHSSPVYEIASLVVSEEPLVDMNIALPNRYFGEGETLVLRCNIKSQLFLSENPDIYWKHNGNELTGFKDRYTMGDGRVVERYSSGIYGNETTDVLLIQDLNQYTNGAYTCVFESNDQGRYEAVVEIVVNVGENYTLMALIIAGSFILIALILMFAILICVASRSTRHVYYVEENKSHGEIPTYVKSSSVVERTSPKTGTPKSAHHT